MANDDTTDEYWDPQDPALPPWDPVLDTAPLEVRKLLLTKRESGKGPPTTLIGRTVDMNRILEHVNATLDDAHPDARPPGMTIRAAPGAGKTSLIQHAQARLRADGIGALELPTRAFENAATFSEAVRKLPPWNQIEADKGLLQSLADGSASIADALISAYATVRMQVVVGEIEPLMIQPVRAVLQAWRDGQVPEMPDVLHLLNQTAKKGMFVFVDEAQRIREIAGAQPRDSFAADAIGRLADPGVRGPAGMDHVNIVLAGLNDLKPTMESLGTYRMNHERLQALRPEAVQELIESNIDQANVSGTTRALAKQGWTQMLMDSFGDWTHHARSAATAARELLDVADRHALDEPWGDIALRYLSERYRNTLYSIIIGNARKAGVSKNVRNAVAEAIRRNGGEVDSRKLTSLVGWTIQREGARDPAPPDREQLQAATASAMRELLRSGVLEEISEDEHPAGAEVHRFGVPSLARYLTKTPAENLSEILEDLAKVELSNDDPPDDDPSGAG